MDNKFSAWLVEQFRSWEKASGQKKSVTAFARYLGVKQPSLNRWMTGDNVPEYENVLKLARKLGEEIFSILDLTPPLNYRNYYWFDGEKVVDGEILNKLQKEFESSIAGKTLNRFEIENARIKFFEDRGIGLFSIRYEEDDDIQYIRDNWQDLPIQLRKKIMSEIRENRGDQSEPENTAQSERLATNTN